LLTLTDVKGYFDTVVVGGGVVGLSAAVRLQETGRSVCVLTAEPPERPTSHLAAAVWYPTGFGEQDNVLGWARRAFEVFSALPEVPGSGVVMRDSLMLLRSPGQTPWWAEAVGGVERVSPEEVSPPYTGGYRFVVPLVEMPVHLPWLLERFVSSGGVLQEHAVRSFREAAAYGDVVVNCTGLKARELCEAETGYPVRGEVVRVSNPSLTVSVRDEENPKGRTYVHPRARDCVLGGTSEPGEWDTTPHPASAAAIVERCTEVVPELARAEILEHHVGLRPARSGGVRLELDAYGVDSTVPLVHNYGHSGAGVTLSWGCAEEVADLVKQAERRQ
jgi:D-amino-acid oxidase